MRPRDAEKVVCDCSANVPRMEFGPKIAWSSGRAGLSSSSWTATPDIDGRDRSFWSSASRGGPSTKLASTILRAGASVVASTTRGARYATPRAHTPLTLPPSIVIRSTGVSSSSSPPRRLIASTSGKAITSVMPPRKIARRLA